MVGTVEEKLHTTGDGAELADDQFVVVERVVVPYRILFKLPWVVYEIVVHCKVTHPNVGICNDLLQVDRLPVSCAGVVFLWVHRGSFLSHWRELIGLDGIEMGILCIENRPLLGGKDKGDHGGPQPLLPDSAEDGKGVGDRKAAALLGQKLGGSLISVVSR